jgi:hypothetical protein
MSQNHNAPSSERGLMRGVLDRLPAALLLLAAALAYSLLWWPGHMSADFLTMYGDARAGTPSDFQSPGFVLVLRLLLPLGAGAGWVLFGQIAGLLLGFFLMFRVRFGRIAAAALAVAVLGTPMALGMGGSLSRDVWFAESMLLAFGCAAAVHRHSTLRARRWWTFCACVAIAGMLFSRQNGLFSAGPAAVAVAAAWRPDLLITRMRAIAAVGVATVGALVILLVGQQAMYRFAGVTHAYPQPALYLYDITAMRQLGAPSELPASVRNVPMDEVVKHFSPAGMAGLVWAAAPPAHFPADEKQRAALSSAWRSAIVHHPVLWLRARGRLFLLQIAVQERAIFIYHPQLDPNTLGLATRWPHVEARANQYIRAFALPDLRGTVLFDVWIYLLICGVAVVKLWPRGDAWRAAALLGAAGLSYQVGLFLLVPAAEYRFSYASVVAGLALAPLLIRRRSQPDASDRGPSGPDGARDR